MTREEAIKNLNMISVAFVEAETKEQREIIDDTFEMAIKALEQEPKLRQALEQEKGAYNALVKNIQCADAISRQAVLDIAKSSKSNWIDNSVLFKRVNELPSVKQEPKTGHWIPTYGNVKCSVCGSVKDSRKVGKATHYCDFCGARMVEPQESEDKE